MRNFVFAVATTAALFAGGTLMSGGVRAAPIGAPNGLRVAIDGLDMTKKAQYIFGGRTYCWYDDGWHGPGWYVCDYGPWVSGLWWGGGYGWHGWRGGHRIESRDRRHDIERRDRRHDGVGKSKGPSQSYKSKGPSQSYKSKRSSKPSGSFKSSGGGGGKGGGKGGGH
jgi:hypothetical protein